MEIVNESIGIVILNYQSYGDTVRLSKKICELGDCCSNINFITCIVDNNSTNDSVKNIKEELSDVLLTDSLHLIELNQNLGYSNGNNEGIHYLRRKGLRYIFIMNNDIYIDNISFFYSMLNTIKNSDAAMIGPGIVQKGKMERALREKRPTLYSLIFENLFLPFFIITNKLERKKLNSSCDKKVQRVYSISGSCFLIDAEKVLDDGLLFDEIVFLYEEENILGEKMFNKNQSVIFNPKVSVIHKHGATITQYYDKKRQNIMKDKSFKEYLCKYRKDLTSKQISIILMSRKIRWIYEDIIQFIKTKSNV